MVETTFEATVTVEVIVLIDCVDMKFSIARLRV